ncbi:MAG TPA: VOC family protein [Verrucomicrobiae bacterium]|jgi:catechol 2,3-dioxygenase-like lactoylglutathione lyase family enzyme|nr:VOC family protein [Verrucomicrobiae bacterium]
MGAEKKTQTNVRQAVPFFHVRNMEESLRFYVDALGFEMTRKWIDEGKLRWCWLEIGDAALMLQEFRKEGHDSWKPSCKVGEGVSVCFMCEDALAIFHEARGRGIKAKRNPFVGNALWVVSFSDPDGYRIDFQSPTDVPEETEHSPEDK